MDLIENYVESRRVTRQSSRRGVYTDELKPRSAMKRKRNSQSTSMNGSEEQLNASAKEEGSPSKVIKLQTADGEDGFQNGDQVDLVKIDSGEEDDQDMNSEDETESQETVINTKPLIKEDNVIRTLRVENLVTDEMKAYLKKKRDTPKISPETEHPKLIRSRDTFHVSQGLSREPTRNNSGSVSLKPLENRNDILTVRSSIKEYRKTMEEKARGDSIAVLQDPYRYPYVKDHTTHIHQRNNFLKTEKQPQHAPKTELGKKKEVTRKTISATSTTGYERGWCRLIIWAVLLLVFLVFFGLMGYHHFSVASFSNRTIENQDRTLSSQHFKEYLVKSKTVFPSQRAELWKRTEIHLMRHLQSANVNEPVSMILTSGRSAENTLRCLVRQLAQGFSNSLNSSMLEIDGSSKSSQHSDQVKLDIDNKLKEAFEGGKQAAVIHRFEELPPGSTLIFYRYCDHENSVFKKVFLAFTVMLPVEDLDSKLSLKSVEEKVYEYLKDKFISSDKTATFNQMDIDKLSGLWSRISHVILPVAAEQAIEQNGCGS